MPFVQQESATPHTADISVLRTLILWDVTLCDWLNGSFVAEDEVSTLL